MERDRDRAPLAAGRYEAGRIRELAGQVGRVPTDEGVAVGESQVVRRDAFELETIGVAFAFLRLRPEFLDQGQEPFLVRDRDEENNRNFERVEVGNLVRPIDVDAERPL